MKSAGLVVIFLKAPRPLMVLGAADEALGATASHAIAAEASSWKNWRNGFMHRLRFWHALLFHSRRGCGAGAARAARQSRGQLLRYRRLIHAPATGDD